MRDIAGSSTLIELLVVILIIGILAAVAVPQYQKNVWKARFTQAKTIAKTLSMAEEAYYLANGKYTGNPDELDVDIPNVLAKTNYSSSRTDLTFPWGNCTIIGEKKSAKTVCSVYKNNSPYLAYVSGLKYTQDTFSQQDACIAAGTTEKPAASDLNYQICVAETNNPTKQTWGGLAWYWVYL